jgi:MFS family permease
VSGDPDELPDVGVATTVRKRILPDVAPLTDSHQFRLLYASQALTGLGRQLTIVASAYQVFLLTNSSLAVGLLSLVQLVPLLLCSFLGGAWADAFDRRMLLLVTQVGLVATCAALAINSVQHDPALWVIFAATSAAAGLSAIDGPARTSAVPTLVRRRHVPAAQALAQVQTQVVGIVGPALAGLLIAKVSLASVYWIHAATCVAAFMVQWMMNPMSPYGGGTRASLNSVMEGLRYVRRQPVLLGVMLADLNAMVFGMPRALFPQIALEQFHGTAGTVGLLYAAPGVGALFGALTTGWVSRVRHHGRGVLVAVAVWGISIAAFGLVPSLPLALLLLAIAGAADVVSAVLRSTIIQLQAPDRLRGRLWSLNIAIVAGGPRLGDVRAGAAAAVSPQFSVVSGGLACTAGIVATNLLLPQLKTWTPSYTTPVDPRGVNP